MENVFTKCLLCGSDRLSPVDLRKKEWLYRCRSCGFVFSRRIPTLEELIKYYSDYTEYDFVNELTRNRYFQWATELADYKKTGRILDVGCGNGIFLEQAERAGWDVYGTEYSDKWIQRCEEKGIRMKKGKLEPTMFPENYFDVIIYLEVIEHINNPHEEIETAKKFLRPGGIIFLTTPNYNSIARSLLKTDWNVITYPEHLSYYTPRTLTRMFSESGFRRLKIRTTGISPGRIRSSLKNKGNESVNPTDMIRNTDQQLRLKLESSSFLKLMKRSVNFILNLTRKGESMHAWFQKP